MSRALPRDAHPLVLDEIDGRLRLASARLTTLPLKKPPLEMTSESVSMLPFTRPVVVISTVAGRHHRALVHPPDEGVDRLNVWRSPRPSRQSPACLPTFSSPRRRIRCGWTRRCRTSLRPRAVRRRSWQVNLGGGPAVLRRGPGGRDPPRSSRTTEHLCLLTQSHSTGCGPRASTRVPTGWSRTKRRGFCRCKRHSRPSVIGQP